MIQKTLSLYTELNDTSKLSSSNLTSPCSLCPLAAFSMIAILLSQETIGMPEPSLKIKKVLNHWILFQLKKARIGI